MTRIQLFNDTLTGSLGFLEVSQDVDIPITLGVAEIRDISKRTGAFSKTITLPGTKINNELFGFVFDVNLSDGTYNINKLQTCAIINDGIVSVDSAFIQLISVRKKQNIANGDDIVEYDVLIKDQVSNFFTRVGSKELSDIPKEAFNKYNYKFESSVMIDTFANQYSNSGDPNYVPFKFWLPYTESMVLVPPTYFFDGYYTKDLQPAIFAKFYWDLIHQQAGYTYTWGSQTSDVTQFDRLLITDNKSQKDANKLTNEYNTIKANNYLVPSIPTMTVSYTSTRSSWTNTYKIKAPSFVKEEIRDNLNFLNHYYPAISNPYPFAQGNTYVTYVPVSPNQNGYSIWTSDVDLAQSPQQIEFNISNFAFYIHNPNAFDVYASLSGGYDRHFEVWLEVFDAATDTIILEEFIASTGDISSSWELDANTSTPYYFNDSVSLSGIINSGAIGSVYSFRIAGRVVTEFPATTLGFNNISSVPADVDFVMQAQNISISITPTIVDAIPYNSTVPLSSYVPKKIKQADFIKSVALMYNLYCVPDPSNPNNLIWIPRDTFYDDGKILDWTYKMDRSQWQEVQFLPDLTAKSITLTYKADNDIANTTYLAATKENYGQQKVIFNSEWVKNDESKELIFSPTPFKESVWGGVTPWYNNIDGTYNLRCLYDNNDVVIDGYMILLDYIAPGNTPIQTIMTSYRPALHSNDPTNPTFDINFGICDYYYTDNYVPTERNLYNLAWKRTMNQIDTSKLMTAYFYLTTTDISNLVLNEKILINNSYWNINRIIDFDYNKPGLTKVELISIDENTIINIE